ncbi:dynein axonemal assembly factor 1 homolog [Culicoides brevitarsis]|uniref:dynein axonemal assembly factor 1 homolog n=1 Tax=Culicoides brevitarsis TaxID=469753 RepID=UPI00307B135F
MGRESLLNKMTKKAILDSCIKNNLYRLPKLNDVLYLHFQGYSAIENLEEYTELKCLWLESNAISEIKGLQNQKLLKCLFLQNNLIEKIENLDELKVLDTLNLCHNYIKKIENCGVDQLPLLNTLNISHNCLKLAEHLEGLKDCKYLSVLDISHNKIEDVVVVKILGDMPQLKVLTMTGNPVINQIPQYRKTLILECKELTYLDSRPVFPRDRACAEAWKRGGFAEEQQEHHRWNKEERRKTRESVNALLALRSKASGDTHFEPLRSSSDEEDDDNVDSQKLKKQTTNIGPNLYDENLNFEQFNLNEWREIEQTLMNTEYAEPDKLQIGNNYTLEKRFDPSDDLETNQESLNSNTNGEEQLINKTQTASNEKIDENKTNEDVINSTSLPEDFAYTFPVKVERSITDDTFPVNDKCEPYCLQQNTKNWTRNIVTEILDGFDSSIPLTPVKQTCATIQIEENSEMDAQREVDDVSVFSKTVLLKNYKNQMEHSFTGPDLCSSELIEKKESDFITTSAFKESSKLQERSSISKTQKKESKKEFDLPSPWNELWFSSSSEEESDSKNDEILKNPIQKVESQVVQLCNSSVSNNFDFKNGSSKDEDCIETSDGLFTKKPIPEALDTETSDIEDNISAVSKADSKYKNKEEVWQIDLHDNQIRCIEKSCSELSLLTYEPRMPSFDFTKEPKDKLFLINKLLESGTNLTFGMDNTLTVGGVLQVTDVERLQAESFRERSDKLQDLCKRIYARRDEINAKFDKIQALWGDFKNPHKGLTKKSEICVAGTSKNSVAEIDFNSLLTKTVNLVQESSKVYNDMCNGDSSDPRSLNDWKSIYLLQPVQSGMFNTNIDLGNDEEKITKGIVSLIIESCVEFNMMREFQFINFENNLKGVVQKYRQRLQKFLNHRNDKQKDNLDTLMTEWRSDRGSAYDFKNIFMSEDEEVREKLKLIVYHEYSIDLDNDQEKVMHLWRMILTCKQVYVGHQMVEKLVVQETSSDDDTSNSDTE